MRSVPGRRSCKGSEESQRKAQDPSAFARRSQNMCAKHPPGMTSSPSPPRVSSGPVSYPSCVTRRGEARGTTPPRCPRAPGEGLGSAGMCLPLVGEGIWPVSTTCSRGGCYVGVVAAAAAGDGVTACDGGTAGAPLGWELRRRLQLENWVSIGMSISRRGMPTYRAPVSRHSRP